ncbi:hypothetical protein [Xanthomonas sp. NCPPB 2632]|uniref:hypothetical protein n=1 Tax=Xanthomonas sp. NCPPB 2632 TaxID=3240912 RepID=UPI003511188D
MQSTSIPSNPSLSARERVWTAAFTTLLARHNPDEAAKGAERALSLHEARWGGARAPTQNAQSFSFNEANAGDEQATGPGGLPPYKDWPVLYSSAGNARRPSSASLEEDGRMIFVY